MFAFSRPWCSKSSPLQNAVPSRTRAAAARQMLQVPEELAKSLTEYTTDPAVVYRCCVELARAITQSGIQPADPWTK